MAPPTNSGSKHWGFTKWLPHEDSKAILNAFFIASSLSQLYRFGYVCTCGEGLPPHWAGYIMFKTPLTKNDVRTLLGEDDHGALDLFHLEGCPARWINQSKRSHRYEESGDLPVDNGIRIHHIVRTDYDNTDIIVDVTAEVLGLAGGERVIGGSPLNATHGGIEALIASHVRDVYGSENANVGEEPAAADE